MARGHQLPQCCPPPGRGWEGTLTGAGEWAFSVWPSRFSLVFFVKVPSAHSRNIPRLRFFTDATEKVDLPPSLTPPPQLGSQTCEPGSLLRNIKRNGNQRGAFKADAKGLENGSASGTGSCSTSVSLQPHQAAHSLSQLQGI